MKTIGQKIKELRRARGFSQQNIAEKLGVTSQAVSKWETDSSLPEMTMLPDIASIFGIQIDDLFEYSVEKRYESIEKKIEYGKVLSNTEFENEESFLLREMEADPLNHDAVSLLANLYRYQADNLKQKTVRYAKRALELKPNDKGDINNICFGKDGKLFDWDTGSHHELIEDLCSILRAEPKNVRIYWYLLDNLIDDGRLREAREVLGESMRKNPDALNAFYEVFITEYEKGFDAVKETYRELAEKHREDWVVLFSVANTFSHHEYYEEALQYWQMTLDCMPEPRYTDPLESMALCCIRMGEYEKAADYYQKEIELLRTDWDVKHSAEVDKLKEKIRQLRTRHRNHSASAGA